jgi:hypothetical protein
MVRNAGCFFYSVVFWQLWLAVSRKPTEEEMTMENAERERKRKRERERESERERAKEIRREETWTQELDR